MEHWTKRKRSLVMLLVGLILFFTASFLTFDWTQVYFGWVRLHDPELMYTRIVKTFVSFLVFVLALSVGKDGIDETDPKKLRRCFVAIFAGDLLFLLDEIHPAFDYAAIIMFLIGHVLIILRNGQGMRAYFRAKSRAKEWIGDIALGIGILLLTTFLFAFTLLDLLKDTPLFYVLILYALVLDLSLWTGWISLRAGHFSSPNARLIALGATCFFVGDYLVGFNLSLGPSASRVLTVFMTWIFYTPAITLFALSGYRWK